MDDTGREYDPTVIANQVWTYLEQAGDAARIMHAYHQDGQYTRMTVVALNPLVVILESRPLSPGTNRSIASPERSYWLAQISSERSQPEYREGLRWCSPDLKQPVTPLTFSTTGEAEIPLPNGKLRLIRSADECRTTRE